MSDGAYRPQYDRIGAYVTVRTAIAPADMCFVFGTRDARGCVRRRHRRRSFPRWLFSPASSSPGGATLGQDLTESDDMKQRLLARGVPASAILCERADRPTHRRQRMTMSAAAEVDAEYGLRNITSLIAVRKDLVVAALSDDAEAALAAAVVADAAAGQSVRRAGGALVGERLTLFRVRVLRELGEDPAGTSNRIFSSSSTAATACSTPPAS